MRFIRAFVAVGLLTAPVLHAAPATYTGVVTDTMCGTNHAQMKVSPDSKCVRECVGDAKTVFYALANGKNIFRLSDQQTPERFAGRKVKVTGVLYTSTNILKVDKIEAAE